MTDSSDPVGMLEAHLGRIESAASRGRLADLEQCENALAEAMKGLTSAPLTEAETARLRAKATLAHDRLIAVLAGLRAARRRLRDITRAAQGVTTYDVRGETLTLALPATATPRRR